MTTESLPVPLAPEAEIALLKEEVFKLRQEKEELLAENKRLSELAIEDALTGVYNRRGFEEMTKKLLPPQGPEGIKERRQQKPLSVLVIDVDNFKVMNDSYGHAAGDKALQALSELLKTKTRKDSDIIARYGGEEFVVLFQNATAKDVIDTTFRWRNAENDGNAKINFQVQTNGEILGITVSGGVTKIKPGETIDDAIARADEALQTAKEGGKDKILNADAQETAQPPELEASATSSSL